MHRESSCRQFEDRANLMASVASRTSTYGFIFWVALAAVGTYFVWPLKQHLKLGTDLIGGFYITLQVQTDEAVTKTIGNHLIQIQITQNFLNRDIIRLRMREMTYSHKFLL